MLTLQEVISSAGLLLDIVGALLIWKYGLPKSINREGMVSIDWGVDAGQKKEAGKYVWRSRRGLILLMFGFAFQLISYWF